MRAGDWMFNPTLTAGMLYDSNVFSSPNKPQSDIAALLGVDLRAHTLWERHGINLGMAANSTLYRNNPGLNETDATFAGTGHFDIDHSTQVLGSLKAGLLHEQVGSLTSPTGAVEPTPFSFISGDLTLRKEFGRLTTVFGARLDSYNFGSTRAQDGSIITQDARDGQIYMTYGRADYAFPERLRSLPPSKAIGAICAGRRPSPCLQKAIARSPALILSSPISSRARLQPAT